MKKIKLGGSALEASEISLGCRRLWQAEEKQTEALIQAALEEGVNFFDLADVYGDGKSEELFGRAARLRSANRERFIIQSKCGIRGAHTPDMHYDFAKDYILSCVDASLKRLGTDYLDVLLLHRPDTLMEPEEVAEAFDLLHESGKVRYFGVSNFNAMQAAFLQRHTMRKLIVNQLQFGLGHTNLVDSGLNVNMYRDESVERDGSILEYCRLSDITIQAWGPFYYGFLEALILGSEKYPQLNTRLNELADELARYAGQPLDKTRTAERG
jgi:predicted oxidoreductase